MPKKILIDFEKIKDPYSGLGQFCAHLKKYFDQSDMNLDYWIPSKLQRLAKKFKWLLPYSDIFHAIHQDSPYLPASKHTKYILTIHDLNALSEQTSFGDNDFYKKKLQLKINRADAITYISEFTKSEVEKNFDSHNKKSFVIYNGISLGKDSNAPKIVPDSQFIFSIGTILPKKNFHVLIDFLKLLPINYKIILAGTTFHSYAQEMINRITAENLQDRLLLIGTINEAEKCWYYQNATAFIFPSLLEGFGLPVAEAMSFGLPLFLSDKTSLPEIGGPDAFYFKNFDANHMAEVFTTGMKNFSFEQKQRLIDRSKMFDWKKSAESYLALYRSL